MRLFLCLGLLALAGCGDDDTMENGGGGGAGSSDSTDASGTSTAGASTSGASSGGATCAKPDRDQPAPRLQNADDDDLDEALGVVTRSEDLELEIDTGFSPRADCVATPVTLTMTHGLALTVPLGALVRVELHPNPSQMGFGNGDPTPTAVVTNVPSAEGFENPVANDERLWFYSSPALWPEAPGIDARLETVCEEDAVTQLIRVSDLIASHDDGEARLAEGDVTTVSLFGAGHEISFLGAWIDHSGFCRWQIARREP